MFLKLMIVFFIGVSAHALSLDICSESWWSNATPKDVRAIPIPNVQCGPYRKIIHLAIDHGNEGALMEFLEKAPDVNAWEGWYKDMSPLASMLIRNVPFAEKGALKIIELGADPNAVPDDGWTPLMYAASRKYALASEALINAGADVNTRIGGKSALMLAGTPAVAKVLLKGGADYNLYNFRGESTLVAYLNWATEPLKFYDITDVIGVVEEIVSAGADIDGNPGDVTPLMTGAKWWHGGAELVNYLVAKGANVDAQTSGGLTPLMFAAAVGQIATGRILLEAGADMSIQDNKGETARNKAQASPYSTRHEFVKMLDEFGTKGEINLL